MPTIIGLDSSTKKWGAVALPSGEFVGGMHGEDLVDSTKCMVERAIGMADKPLIVVIAKPLELPKTPHVNAVLHHAFGLIQMALAYNYVSTCVVSESESRAKCGIVIPRAVGNETEYMRKKRIKSAVRLTANRMGFSCPECAWSDDIYDAWALAYAYKQTTRGLFA